MTRLPLILLIVVAAAEQPGSEFHHDFRNKGFPNPNFRSFGPEAVSRIKAEQQGLRITMPTGQLPRGNIGVATLLNPKGDFEVAVGYEIIQMDQPKAGRTGFYVNLQTDRPTKDSVAFFRMRLADGRDVYRSGLRRVNQQGKVENPSSEYIPAGGKSGQLRIVRVGSEAVLSVAEQPDNQFRELYRWNLGPEDIDLLAIGVNSLNSEGEPAIDVRVTDLRVRGKTDRVNSVAASAVEPPYSRGTSLWLAAALVALVLVTGAVLIWWQRTRARGEQPKPVTGKRD